MVQHIKRGVLEVLRPMEKSLEEVCWRAMETILKEINASFIVYFYFANTDLAF